MSVLLLTINSNFSKVNFLPEESADMRDGFAKILVDLFSKRNFPHMISQPKMAQIKGISIEPQIEYGSKLKKLHSHNIIEINHGSDKSAKLNVDEIRKFVNARLKKLRESLSRKYSPGKLNLNLFGDPNGTAHVNARAMSQTRTEAIRNARDYQQKNVKEK